VQHAGDVHDRHPPARPTALWQTGGCFRDLMEIWLWRQSNRLVGGEKIWETARRRDPSFTCANLFWWYNMAATHDVGVTPRPIYKADGRKLPDCYTQPLELREELTQRLGPFPLFHFWGPATSIASSRWIADAALHVRRSRAPTLTLVYLPHLDYDLQRFGPHDPRILAALREIDSVAGDLIADAGQNGARVIVLSEYGITPVSRPVHINRALREAGSLRVRREGDGELLDPIQSDAFAVSDHQIAHVYVARPELVSEVREVIVSLAGIDCVLDRAEQHTLGLDHARSGELVALARHDAWFTSTTGLMTVTRRTSPGLSRSTANPATIRSSYFSTPRYVFPSWPSARGSHGAPLD